MRNISQDGALQQPMDDWTTSALSARSGEGVSLPGMSAPAPREATLTEGERTLIQRARARDQDAFAVLVRLHQRQIYNLALRMLRDREEASEATQEVFLAAWQGLPRFREEARFATWLYRIAYRHCLKVAESQRRDGAARAELAAEAARASMPEALMSRARAGDAETAMREAVRAEVASLPPRYRSALVLRHMQDLSYEEIAEVMRVPIGTVKTHLFRARAILRDRLNDLERVRDEGLARAEDLRAGLQLGLEAGLRSLFEFEHQGGGPTPRGGQP